MPKIMPHVDSSRSVAADAFVRVDGLRESGLWGSVGGGRRMALRMRTTPTDADVVGRTDRSAEEMMADRSVRAERSKRWDGAERDISAATVAAAYRAASKRESRLNAALGAAGASPGSPPSYRSSWARWPQRPQNPL